jgi:hypothetical protein
MHHVMAEPKQITIRNPSPELSRRLREISKARGESLNATVLLLLEQAVGCAERSERLRRYVTWTEADLAEFDLALAAQRTIDEALWR